MQQIIKMNQHQKNHFQYINLKLVLYQVEFVIKMLYTQAVPDINFKQSNSKMSKNQIYQGRTAHTIQNNQCSTKELKEATTHKGNPPELQSNHDSNYITKQSNSLMNILGLHYMKIFTNYYNGVNSQTIIEFQPEYERMIKNQYIWHRYLSQKKQFSLTKEILEAEKGPLIFVLIFSMLIGIVTLVGAYYQRFLFWQHTEQDYHVSGWVFFSIIITAAFVRFFLFNYVQSLANQVAINIRIHLQNAYVKCLINLPQKKENDLKGMVYFNYFSCIQVVTLALKSIPYFLSSIVVVFGIIGLVIDIVGWLGIILLGITLVGFLIQIAFLYIMFHIHEHYSALSNERNSIWIFSTSFFIKLVQSGMNSKYVQRILNLRKEQTTINVKYTIYDGMIQIITESTTFFTIFLFYLIEQHLGYPDYKQIFECVVLFTVFKTPAKMVAYGLVFMMELYSSLHQLQLMFDRCEVQQGLQIKEHFPRFYSHRSTFWMGEKLLSTQKQIRQTKQKEKKNDQDVQKHRGKLMIMISKNGYKEDFDIFINKMVKNTKQRLKYVKISHHSMIMNESFRDNITFGLNYDEVKFKKVIKVLNLDADMAKFQGNEEAIVNANYISAVDNELVQKISIARALYQQVDVLFISHLLAPEFGPTLQNIRKYRDSRNQITFISHELGINLRSSDQVVFFTSDGSAVQDSFQGLKSICSQFKEYIQAHEQLQEKQMLQLQNHKKSSLSKHCLNNKQQSAQNIGKPQLQQNQSLGHRNQTMILEDNSELDFKITQTQFQEQKNSKKLKCFPSLQYNQKIKTSYKNLFRFYNYNHVYAGIFLLIVLCLPPLIDLYMEVIVAESKDFFSGPKHNNHSKVQEQQHKITLRYGFSFALFFVLNIIKVVILAFYLRSASYKIFQDLIKAFINSKTEPTVVNYHKKNGLDLERNLQSIDIRTTTEFDITFTIFFEHLNVLIFASISSEYFLGVGIPFMILSFFILIVMVYYSRTIFDSNRENRSRTNEFIKKLIRRRSQIKSYERSEFFFNKFTQLNRQDITYELNKDWLFEALTIIFQFIIILMLIAVLIISLIKFHQIHLEHEAFLELSISFLIAFANSGRLDLKIFRAIDRQVVGISCLWRMGEHHNHKVHEFKDLQSDQIQSIQFDNFTVDFFNQGLQHLSVNFFRGERVACVCDMADPLRIGFLSLFRLFDKEKVKGGIRVNGVDLYQEKITRQCMQKYVHVISDEVSFKTFGETVSAYIQGIFPETSEQQIEEEMKKLWKIFGCKPMFQLNTHKDSLAGQSLDVFRLLVGLMSKCEVLILQHCLNQIDIMQRQKLGEWMKSCNISIIIELTTKQENASFYPRKLYFEDGKIVNEFN